MKKALLLLAVVAFAGIAFASHRKDHVSVLSEPIKVGVISPMTGSGSSYGEPIGLATLLAAEKINQEWGVLGREIEIIIEDGMCDPKEAVNAARKLVDQDQVSVVLGGGCSSESLAIAPFLNERKVLHIAAATSANDFTSAGEYSFRVMPRADTIFQDLGAYAYYSGDKRIAILYESKEYPRGVVDSFIAGFEKAGGEVVTLEAFPPEQLDLNTYITKISGTDATAIMFAAQDDKTALNFFTQLGNQGLIDNYRYYTDLTSLTKDLLAATNGAIAEKAFNATPYVPDDSPSVQEIKSLYKERFGSVPETANLWLTSAFDRIYLLRDAIETCGSEEDTECLKDYLYSVQDYEAASGKLSFDKYGDVTLPIFLHYFDSNGEEVWKPISR